MNAKTIAAGGGVGAAIILAIIYAGPNWLHEIREYLKLRPDTIVSYDTTAGPNLPDPPAPFPNATPEVLAQDLLTQTEQRVKRLMSYKGELANNILFFDYEIFNKDIILKFRGKKDLYPSGEMYLERSVHARQLGDAVVDVYRKFANIHPVLKNKGVNANIYIQATSDAEQMGYSRVYQGHSLSCNCESEKGSYTLSLRNEMSISNEELGCARGAVFASYLRDRGIELADIKIGGRTLDQIGGEYRQIRIELTLGNIVPLIELSEIDLPKNR